MYIKKVNYKIINVLKVFNHVDKIIFEQSYVVTHTGYVKNNFEN